MHMTTPNTAAAPCRSRSPSAKSHTRKRLVSTWARIGDKKVATREAAEAVATTIAEAVEAEAMTIVEEVETITKGATTTEAEEAAAPPTAEETTTTTAPTTVAEMFVVRMMTNPEEDTMIEAEVELGTSARQHHGTKSVEVTTRIAILAVAMTTVVAVTMIARALMTVARALMTIAVKVTTIDAVVTKIAVAAMKIVGAATVVMPFLATAVLADTMTAEEAEAAAVVEATTELQPPAIGSILALPGVEVVRHLLGAKEAAQEKDDTETSRPYDSSAVFQGARGCCPSMLRAC